MAQVILSKHVPIQLTIHLHEIILTTKERVALDEASNNAAWESSGGGVAKVEEAVGSTVALGSCADKITFTKEGGKDSASS